jgi:cell division septum initiation protein DivIVA
LSQIEMSESFNTVVEGDDYQKSKLFLDVLNAEISERGDIEEEALEEKAKPDFLDMDKDGNKKEPMKKAVKDKEEQTDESQYKMASPKPYKLGGGKGCKPGFVLDRKTGMCMPKAPKGISQAAFNKSIVREGAEDNAEIIMAAKDMVDRVTNWMEDTAEMQTESMLELADAIRDEMGVDQSTQFVQGVKPALEGLYSAMEQARESLSNGVGLLTGEGAPAPAMGAEEMPADDMGMEPTVDMDAAEPMPAEGDVDLAAAGGEEPAGRETRESVDPRNLARKLSKKK